MTEQTTERSIGGMTCASCAARIEKKLNRLDGVTATVNFATEKATVTFPPGMEPARLVATVEATGYTATLSEPPADGDQPAALRTRLLVSAVLAAPVLALAMVPALRFPGWPWLSAALTAPVVFWGGRRFHTAAWRNVRHGAAT